MIICDKYIYRSWACLHTYCSFVHFALFHVFLGLERGEIDRPSKSWEIEKHRKVYTFSVHTSGFQRRQITAPKKRNTILLTIFPINFTEIWNRFEIYGMAGVQLEIWIRCDIPINWYIHGNIEIELLISGYYFFKSNFSTTKNIEKEWKSKYYRATKYDDLSTVKILIIMDWALVKL